MVVFEGLTTVPLEDFGGLTTVPMAGFGGLTTVPLTVAGDLTTVPMASSVRQRIEFLHSRNWFPDVFFKTARATKCHEDDPLSTARSIDAARGGSRLKKSGIADDGREPLRPFVVKAIFPGMCLPRRLMKNHYYSRAPLAGDPRAASKVTVIVLRWGRGAGH
jgi:hypothetical protein